MLRSAIILILALGSFRAIAAEEIFELKSGGQVRGEWLNRDESPREKYTIRTSAGELSFPPGDVTKVVLLSAQELLYEQKAAASPDTAEAHWQLSQWCQENKLTDERRDHLTRVIELDPQHAAARAALGFRQVNGQWVTRDEEMATKGLKLYEGRYVTAQEIELRERDKKDKLAEREWARKIKLWRGWLGTDKTDAAVANFKDIKDIAAIAPLIDFMAEEKNRDTRLLYIDVFARLADRLAVKALVDCSLDDPDQEVRLTALDRLVANKPPEATTQYISALHDKSNVRVNRAAGGLQSLGDKNAILPLIEALVTEHKFLISAGTPPGQMSTTFGGSSGGGGGGGGGGMSFGSKPPQIVKQKIANKDVLSALIALSEGQSFSYDKAAWKRWYAADRRVDKLDARRDNK